MKTLVLGASGATGKLAVAELVRRGRSVIALVRSTATVPDKWRTAPGLEVVTGTVEELSRAEVAEYLRVCDTVVCCLGHNITLRGLFGKPRRLVHDAVAKLADAAEHGQRPVRLIVMSTTAYTNRGVGDQEARADATVLGLMERLLPPHADNVATGDYLLNRLGSSKIVEWVAVRPDSLVDAPALSRYTVSENRLRSPVFDPGQTSRVQVADFMVNLVLDEALWRTWRGKTPVVYDGESL